MDESIILPDGTTTTRRKQASISTHIISPLLVLMNFLGLKRVVTMAAPTKLPDGTITTRSKLARKISQTKFFFILLISSSDAKIVPTMKELLTLTAGWN
jgi:hypothetical protein